MIGSANPVDWRAIEYFTASEFKCPCCDKEHMDNEFVMKFDLLRGQAGFPIIVTSGWRCPEYNDKISSTGLDGPHTTGKAADFAVSFHRARVILGLIPGHFSGIGIKQHGTAGGRFYHVDILKPRVWTYS